jgi:hypothetical protein
LYGPDQAIKRPRGRQSGRSGLPSRARANESGGTHFEPILGSFVVKLAICENARSGKIANWPPAPLTVHGSFDRLPHRAG